MKTALAILQLVPAIIALIPSLNAFIPQKGQGPVKLELAKTILTYSYDGISAIWPTLEKIVAALCSAKKTVEAATTPTVPPVQ
jgi:hypothetical protein